MDQAHGVLPCRLVHLDLRSPTVACMPVVTFNYTARDVPEDSPFRVTPRRRVRLRSGWQRRVRSVLLGRNLRGTTKPLQTSYLPVRVFHGSSNRRWSTPSRLMAHERSHHDDVHACHLTDLR